MRIVLALGLALLVAVGSGCDGDDSDGTSDALSIPRKGHPDFGAFGHVLGSDLGQSNDDHLDRLWIGFGQRESWNAYLAVRDRLAPDGIRPWICGHVVTDPAQPLGFYFDPATTVAAEITAETFQISLDGLKNDPDPSGRWCVAFFAEQVVPGDGE